MSAIAFHPESRMNASTSHLSPKSLARIGGALYIFIIVAGIFGEAFVRDALIVSGNAAATAANVAAHEGLWRLGIAGDLAMHIADLPLLVILYVLIRPVNRDLALLVLLFDAVQSAVLVASKMNLLMPLFAGGDASYLRAFTPEQLQALSYLSMRMDSHGFGFGLIFFGCGCLVLGWLIRRSGYLPWILGMLIQLAGACYLINSFALILAPALAGALFPAIMVVPFVAETSLALWLLVKGVDEPRWNARAAEMRA
ncbi:MAG TPA: DUF4386 domain-containing protein [Rhodanobacteraceae bacterium]|nr:DUF4386 domain-containing protein [Rhodanobacteraceae bacterium]